MIMKRFFEKFVRPHRLLTYYEYPKLGRWNLDYDNAILQCKIAQANEDHCGCCVVGDKYKKVDDDIDKNDKNDKNAEEHMLPYCM